MKIAIGSDHAGFAAKEILKSHLRKRHEVVDCGTDGVEPVDYPDFAKPVADMVASGMAERGILICGSGIGMCISANKVRGIRAASCQDEEAAVLSRKHNDANVLCLGGRLLKSTEIIRITDAWLSARFEGGRHARRVGKVMSLEGGT